MLFAIAVALTMAQAGAEAKTGRFALEAAHVQNFEYELGENSNVEGGKVPLVNGSWTDAKGGSSFSLRTHTLGDLDGDGHRDAVAVLAETTGGTGHFYYMFAIGSRGGRPVQLGEPEWLGDRAVIQRLSIDRRGTITVRYVTHADGDPACCPTMTIEDRYRVQGGKLVGITR